MPLSVYYSAKEIVPLVEQCSNGLFSFSGIVSRNLGKL